MKIFPVASTKMFSCGFIGKGPIVKCPKKQNVTSLVVVKYSASYSGIGTLKTIYSLNCRLMHKTVDQFKLSHK